MLFIFLIQHSSEKPVRTHRTKMYTKCKFKNMSKNITYNLYRPIISNYYNLVLMLVTSDFHRDSLSHDRRLWPRLWLFVAFGFHFRYTGVSSSPSGWRDDAMEFEVISTTTLPKLEPRSNPKPKTQNPWTRSVWNHSKLDWGNSQRSWMPFHNPCRLCGPTWRTCPQRSTD